MEERKRILIVDDEQINLDFFDLMLSRLGFVVEKAESGQAALEIVKRFNPDLIILDNIMPKLSGWEVTKILKNSPEYADYSGVPIIMFSAMDDIKDKIEGFDLGIEDYITKPYNFSEVLARIRTVLKKQELISELAKRDALVKLSDDLAQSVDAAVAGIESVVAGLRDQARAVKAGEADADSAAESVEAQCSLLLEKIAQLKDTVRKQQADGNEIKKTEVSLKALDAKYQKDFQQK